MSTTEALAAALRRAGHEVSLEHQFHPNRRWRIDVAVPGWKTGIEIEGGIWNKGAHARPAGIRRDIIKYNSAAELGWTIFRCTHDISGAEGWPAVLAQVLGVLAKLRSQ